MAKGEVAFSTIVLIIIAVIVIVAVMVFFLPAWTQSSEEITSSGGETGLTSDAVTKARCESLCIKAQNLADTAIPTSDFCTDNDCKGGTIYPCSGVSC